ncbi:MAG: hypothetical protein K8R49_07430 [Candidatus Cloacimonetes bacterium]|nr:hypothetical protein [Candidatus Cloacimonadota bacterium]
MIKKIYVILFLLILISCSLDRSNPLDPLNSGKDAPRKVTGIVVTNYDNTSLVISWDTMQNIDGYYIYRSTYFDGKYRKIVNEISHSDSLFEDTDVELPEKFYYYKMSAFKDLNGKILEGYRSEPKYVN